MHPKDSVGSSKKPELPQLCRAFPQLPSLGAGTPPTPPQLRLMLEMGIYHLNCFTCFFLLRFNVNSRKF